MANSGSVTGHICGKRDWGKWKGYQQVKHKRRIILVAALLLLLAGLCAALFFVRAQSGNGAAPSGGADTLTELTADRIREIRCQAFGKETMAFSRNEDGLWEGVGEFAAATAADTANPGTAAVDTANPAATASGTVNPATAAAAAANPDVPNSENWDQGAISELASSFTGVRLYQTIRDVKDLSQYGLDDPAYRVTITDTAGEVTEIAIGDLNETVNKLFCCLNGDRTVVYVVSPALTTNLSKTAADYKSVSASNGS